MLNIAKVMVCQNINVGLANKHSHVKVSLGNAPKCALVYAFSTENNKGVETCNVDTMLQNMSILGVFQDGRSNHISKFSQILGEIY